MSIYLDHNATTPLAPEAIKATKELLPGGANASSTHSPGQAARDIIETSRKQLASLLGCRAPEIVFCSGATEANNAVFNSVINDSTTPLRKTVLISSVEHPSVYQQEVRLKQAGFDVKRIKIKPSGELDIQDYKEKLSSNVALVSVMWVNNETGIIHPVETLAKLAQEAGALFHTDAVQAVGKLKVDLAQSKIDFLSLSAHKIGGPAGTGALVIRQGTRFTPLLVGGEQENNRRAGTENLSQIAGLAQASKMLGETMTTRKETISALNKILEDGLREIPDTLIHGIGTKRVINTTQVSFKGCEGDALLMTLNDNGIYASAGSACSSGLNEPSAVLLAMKVPRQYLAGTLRFSLSHTNTAEEIARTLEVLNEAIKIARS